MKYYLIAGEVSGDLHAARLMKALKREAKAIFFRYIGGKNMQAVAPKDLFMDLKNLNVMGGWEVVKKFWILKTYIQNTCTDLLKFKPDALILVDFAGFNLRIAKFAKAHRIKVIYYILPKLWAWNERRIYKLKRYVDDMYIILPFEQDFYRRHQFQVHYFGNPLVDLIHDFQNKPKLPPLSAKKIIALLPGSRRQEIENILPIMLSITTYFKDDYDCIVAGLRHVPESCYNEVKKQNFQIIWDDSYTLLSQAFIALVTSGTATLETAMFKVPQVVCYKSSLLTYHLAKIVIKVPYISLVNLIAGKTIVKELIQYNYTTKNLYQAITELIVTYDEVLTAYDLVLKDLGSPSIAAKVARSILERQ